MGRGSVETDGLALATNPGSSNYHSLQAQYRRRLAHGFSALASYAWSHSIDNSSTDSGIYWAGSGLTPAGDRASSDFDARQSFTAGFSYEIPAGRKAGPWGGWALDGVLHARAGFPITLLDAEQFTGASFENGFRPNLAWDQPNWIADASAPGR